MNQNNKAFIALLIGALMISFSPVLIKMTGAPGLASSFYRMFLGSIILLVPFVLNLLKTKERIPLKGVGLAVLASLSFAFDMALWTTGIMKTNASMPTLVGNMAPLWVGIGAYFIFKERYKPLFWVGLFVAFVGVALLFVRDLYASTGLMGGLVYGSFAGMFYAGFLLLTQPGRKYLSTLSFLFIYSVGSSAFLSIFMLIKGVPFTGYSDHTWLIFITMGIVIQAGAWFLINFAQGYLPASLISPTLLTQPVLAAVIAYYLLGEELTIWQIGGGLVVMSGIYLVHYSSVKKKRS